MNLTFKFHKETKRRWRYKLFSIDNGQATVMEKRHTELIIYKKLFRKKPEVIKIEINKM